MRDRMEVRVALAMLAGQVIDQEDGDASAGKILLQGQHLTAIAQGVLCQQPEFGQAVEDQALWLRFFHALHDQIDRGAELDLPRVQHGLLATIAQNLLGRGQLEQIDAVERPTMRLDDGRAALRWFPTASRRGSVSPDRTPSIRNCSPSVVLPDPGAPFKQVNTARRQTTTQDEIKSSVPEEIRGSGML